MAKILKNEGKNEPMNTIFYILIFFMGIFFGSFFTLAIHRIPKREDITHTHSYCPNCNHKLGFLDLFPVFSYIILGGKCRYCKEKIRPRYLILEITSGLVFVLLAYLMNINIENLNTIKIANSAFIALYLCFIFILGGIDKEKRKIEKPVVMYGILISLAYIIYLCIVEGANIYRYGIYLVFYILFLILDTITLRKYAKNSYLNNIILSTIVMVIFTGEYITTNTIIITLLAIAIYILIYKIKNWKNRSKKTDKQVSKNITIGYIMSVANILNLIFVLGSYKFLI